MGWDAVGYPRRGEGTPRPVDRGSGDLVIGKTETYYGRRGEQPSQLIARQDLLREALGTWLLVVGKNHPRTLPLIRKGQIGRDRRRRARSEKAKPTTEALRHGEQPRSAE